MINILIRTSNRHKEFSQCIKSIRAQTYKNVRLIISSDKHKEDYPFVSDVTEGFDRTIHFVDWNGQPYGWNLYCNTLKSHVKEGWFFYLDDDDWLSKSRSLMVISKHLKDPEVGVICQYYRKRMAKPSNLVLEQGYVKPESIIKGHIGGSAIFLHASQKEIADWQSKKAADFDFIKDVSSKIPLKFVAVPVVQTGNSGRHGR